jgi:hypothetical protein
MKIGKAQFKNGVVVGVNGCSIFASLLLPYMIAICIFVPGS